MANIPAKVQARLAGGLKKFQSIVVSAKAKDINESDTVVNKYYSCKKWD